MKSKKSIKYIKKRKEIVEHPFGTIKGNWGYRQFLTRGIESVKSEFNLICLAYNMKRVLNIFNFKELMSMIQIKINKKL